MPSSNAQRPSNANSVPQSASSPTTSSSPPKSRARPPPLIGIDPGTLVGRVLTSIRKSPVHPSLTLNFADRSTIQVLVDGYDPHPGCRGIPKQLEMNSASDPIFNPPSGHLDTDLTIRDCAFVKLLDRAFDMKESKRGAEWDQTHQGIAFKFHEQSRWHCIWATLAEHDDKHGTCVFRSYNDVYLQSCERPPRRRNRSPKKGSSRRRS
jgi:hypothetical protein